MRKISSLPARGAIEANLCWLAVGARQQLWARAGAGADRDDGDLRWRVIDAERLGHDDTAALAAKSDSNAVAAIGGDLAVGVAAVPSQRCDRAVGGKLNSGGDFTDAVAALINDGYVHQLTALEPEGDPLTLKAAVSIG